MTEKLGRGAQKLQQYLNDAGCDVQVQELPDSTRTAVDAATAIGCELGQIAKSLVFAHGETEQLVLVIAAGDRNVDTAKLASATGAEPSLANPKMIKRELGYPIGGVPPVGHARKLPTLLDESLRRFELLWAAAGSPHAVFSISVTDLHRLTGGSWSDLTTTI